MLVCAALTLCAQGKAERVALIEALVDTYSTPELLDVFQVRGTMAAAALAILFFLLFHDGSLLAC